MRYIVIALIGLLVTPFVAHAQTSTSLFDLLGLINALINQTIPVVIALAFLFFLWGIAKFIFFAGDEKKVAEGRLIMVWGIIALFVLVAVWGIVNSISYVLGIPYANAPALPLLPQLPPQGS
jgi:hypothetical protein